MRRREAAAVLAALGAASRPALGQRRARTIRIGVLDTSTRADTAPRMAAFKQAFAEYGYIEGRDYAVELRHADNRTDRLTALAAELVQLQVDLIIARAATATRAAKEATNTIPIVMVSAGDPIKANLVESLSRPGTNVTGTSNSLTDIASKHLELVREAVPGVSRLAVLLNPNYASHRAALEILQAAAPAARVTILPVEARTADQLDQAFALMGGQAAEAIIVVTDPIFASQRRRIADLMVKGRLPGIGYSSEYADGGFLMGYGPNNLDFWRRSAYFADRIVRGAKPAELPVEQPSQFELVINLKTARALALTIPRTLLLRADRVIE